MKSLVILTTSYPYSGSLEGNFIIPEIPHLQSHFSSVEFLPCNGFGKLGEPVKPSTVDDFLSREIGKLDYRTKIRFAAKAVRNRKNQRIDIEEEKPPLTRPKAYLAHLADLGMANRIYRYLSEGIQGKRWDPANTLFYSYWAKHTALALVWLKNEYPDVKAVTRAHRNDLYREEAPNGFLSGQSAIISKLDGVFSISEHGKDYLVKRHPDYASKIQVARLGTRKVDFRAFPSNDDQIRITTCSGFARVKRLDLAWESLRMLCKRIEKPVHWTHIGGGKGQERFQDHCRSASMPNLEITFTGTLTLDKIMDHYRSNPIDAFLNTSSSEGIPVSIMEAMSCGIPCIAPSVGGVPEIVSSAAGGELFDKNASAEEISEKLALVVQDNDNWLHRSEAAYSKWADTYHADSNHSIFAKKLSSLIG